MVRIFDPARFMGPWAHGPKGPMGPMGPWAHGPLGPWAQGPRAPWAPGPNGPVGLRARIGPTRPRQQRRRPQQRHPRRRGSRVETSSLLRYFGAVEAYVAAMSSHTHRERSRSRDNSRSPPEQDGFATIRLLPIVTGPGWVVCRDRRCRGRTFNVTIDAPHTLLCATCGTTMTLPRTR